MTVITDPTSQGGANTVDTNIPVIGQMSPGGTQSYVPPPTVPTALDSSTTQPNSAVVVPPATPDTTNYAGIIAGTQPVKVDTTSATPYTDTATSLLNNINTLYGVDTGKSAYTQSQLDASGATALTARQNELSGQLTALNNEAQAIPLQQQQDILSRGITTKAGVAPLQSNDLRNNAIKALSLKSEYDLNSGQLQNAQDTAQRAVDLKYKDVEDNIANYEKQLQAISPFLSNEQKNQADAQQAKIDAQKTALADAKKQQQDVIDAAQTAGDSISAGKALALDPTSPTFQQDLATVQSQVQKATVKASAVTTPAGSTIVPTTTDPTGQTSSIENDVSAVLSGRNTLYNIRQTMGRSNAAAAYMQQMRDAITKIDPNFDFVASDAGGKAVSQAYFQKSIAAIDSVLPNINKLVDLSNDVSRIGVKGVDNIIQATGLQFGNQKVSNFRQAQKLIADEIGLALGAGTVSDMKLQLGFDVTDPTVTPEVFASNMQIVKDFVNNRKQALNDLRYKSDTTSQTSKFDTLSNDINPAPNGKDAYIPRSVWTTVDDKDGLLNYVKSLGYNLLVQ